ncbi:MAG: long-chain fatty acid--CoA ligase [Candidatus Heimdallarchaeota archaeon]|nr:long-chain fatty acid--CoA ligase [Candidatus Heimdallarchaeota archaeon]
MARHKYHPNIPAEVDIPIKSMGEVFFDAVKKSGDLPFLYFQGKGKSYNEAAKEVRKLANAFKDLGIKKGDRIAILTPNCPQFVITYLSTIYLGAIVTAISPLSSPKEVKFQLKDSGSRILVTLDMYLDLVREIRDETDLEHVIISSVADELSAIKGFLYKNVIARKNPKVGKEELKYKEVIMNGADKEIKTDIDPKNDLLCLQYTGGTTGSPKGAMLTHYNLVSQAMILDYWMEWIGGKLPIQETMIGALPFSHIFGLTTSFFWPMSIGGMIDLIPDPRKLEGIMKDIQKYKIQFFMGVPTLFQKLAEQPYITKYDWSSLRMCISGGSALHPEVMRNFEDKTGTILVEGYGLSEASPVTHVNPADAGIRQDGIGMPIPNTETKIIDINSGEDIPEEFDEDGQTAEGELLIRGPQVMKGYWNKPEETANVLLEDGWLRTGDVVRMNKDGFFRIVDRLKDCIFTSGYQVWPLEVETVLCNHPDVFLAAVIPIKETHTHNEVIKAVLVAAQDAPRHDKNALKAYCKQHLAPYKVPKFFEYREELPLSPVGKVLRRPLREEAAIELVQSEISDS